jgi:hypothetical protein
MLRAHGRSECHPAALPGADEWLEIFDLVRGLRGCNRSDEDDDGAKQS